MDEQDRGMEPPNIPLLLNTNLTMRRKYPFTQDNMNRNNSVPRLDRETETCSMESDNENSSTPNTETLERCCNGTLECNQEETTNTESKDILSFEISDLLRESMFGSLAETSSTDAADFEFRTHPSFLQVLKEISGTCRSFFLEKSKLVSLRLPLTSATLLGQLETVFNTYPKSFKQVAFYTSDTCVFKICECMRAVFQGNLVIEENFSNVSQFCQRKKIELNVQFCELSLHLRSFGVMPFTPVWETSLTSMYICFRVICTASVKYLSEALPENTTLTSLNIESNNIGTEGEKFETETSKYLNRNISKRNRENISNASAVTAPVANSTLTLDSQRKRNSLEYLSSLDQTFVAYRDTHLKESTLLFILYMQSRRMEMQLFPSTSYFSYPSSERMTYFILNDSKSIEVRKEPHCFESNHFTCAICCNICISPYNSENCSHVFLSNLH
eukprot:jgi/Galph1/4843/GphlegSOOS_G3491.1